MTSKELKREIQRWCLRTGKTPENIYLPVDEFEDLIRTTGDKGSLKWFETDAGIKQGIWFAKCHVFKSNQKQVEIV